MGQEGKKTFGVFFKFGCFGHGADGGGNFLCGQIGVFCGKRPPSYTLEELFFKGNRILFVEMANRDVCRQSKNSDCTHKRSIFYGSGAYHACCCICLLLHTSYGRDMSDSLCRYELRRLRVVTKICRAPNTNNIYSCMHRITDAVDKQLHRK